MKIILQGQELIHWTTTTSCTNISQCLKQWTYQMQKQQWIKNRKTWKDTGMAADESKKHTRCDRWSKERKKNSTFCVVVCHLKNSELEPKFQKYRRPSRTPRWHCKRRFWLLRCFNGAGLSASQLTTAKVMDAIARLPGCAGRAADAESVKTKSKWRTLPH